jgi:dephospho-CoA kinase
MKALAAQWNRLTPEQRLHGRSYPIVALTGGVASGKSTVAAFLKEQGVPMISADQLVKDIYAWKETQAWLKELCPAVITESGIDFPQLRKIVFTDPALKAQVETYLYERLPQAFTLAEKKFPRIPWLVYEIPLLFERNLQSSFDVVIVTWVRREVQKNRLLSRDPHTTVETAEAILAQQLSLDEKKLRADLVFDNSGPLEKAALKKLWAQLT